MKKFIIIRDLENEEQYLDQAFEITGEANFDLLENHKNIQQLPELVDPESEWIIFQNCPMYLAWSIFESGINIEGENYNHFSIVFLRINQKLMLTKL